MQLIYCLVEYFFQIQLTEMPSTLGKFEAFPEHAVQALAELTYNFQQTKLQMLIIEALNELNNKTEIADGDLVTTVSPVTCKYEIGIAEGVYFNFLIEDEIKKIKEQVRKKPFNILDFIFYVFFKHIRGDGKEVSLWSDSDYVRFNLTQTKKLKILVHQFKGTRKLPLDVLIKKIVERINEKAQMQGLKPVKLEVIRGH